MVKIAVTGRPGIGKTTFCLKVYERLKHTCEVCGFVTLEVREKGKRVGFKLLDLKTGKSEWLAKVGKGRITVGKYVVFTENLDKFINTLHCEGIIILDEVGPMELKSKKFVDKVEELLKSDKSMLFSIHFRSKHPLVEKIRKNFEVIVLNESNRNLLVDKVVEKLILDLK